MMTSIGLGPGLLAFAALALAAGLALLWAGEQAQKRLRERRRRRALRAAAVAAADLADKAARTAALAALFLPPRPPGRRPPWHGWSDVL